MSEAGDRESGMTLLEALVVVAILGFVSTLIFPSLEKATEAFSLRASASAVIANMRMARAESVRGGRTVAFAIAPGGKAYRWAGGQLHVLPKGEILDGTQAVSFFADGSASGGAVSLSGSGKRISISVDPATGTIFAGGL